MNIQNYLKEHGVKPSYQRIKVFEYLYREMSHPTVDEIYTSLVESIPTLSKTTVYNTLKLFVDKNITSTLTIEDNEVRYDAMVEEHAHFKCESCGNIYDVDVDYSGLSFKKMDGFEVDATSIHLKGKCKKCLTLK